MSQHRGYDPDAYEDDADAGSESGDATSTVTCPLCGAEVPMLPGHMRGNCPDTGGESA